jgi:hypothetical protein
MTEASVSFAGNLTDDPEIRSTDSGIARAIIRVAVSGRREQELGDRHAGQGHQERRRVATRAVASHMADQAPMVLGPPLLLVSSCFPQPRHWRYQPPWGLRRRCQRWSRSLHRQGLAIVASLGIGHTGSPSQTLGSYQPAVQVEAQSLDWTCRSKRRRRPGRRAARASNRAPQAP